MTQIQWTINKLESGRSHHFPAGQIMLKLRCQMTDLDFSLQTASSFHIATSPLSHSCSLYLKRDSGDCSLHRIKLKPSPEAIFQRILEKIRGSWSTLGADLSLVHIFPLWYLFLNLNQCACEIFLNSWYGMWEPWREAPGSTAFLFLHSPIITASEYCVWSLISKCGMRYFSHLKDILVPSNIWEDKYFKLSLKKAFWIF